MEIINLGINKLNKILSNKKTLEKKLNIKIEIVKNHLEIDGDEIDLYPARKIFDAINKNFSLTEALLLLDPEYMIEDINIKTISKKKNLELVRARIIGTEGRTIETLENLSECFIKLNDNIVSVIGHYERMKDILHALRNLISGSKQANVYKFLEHARDKLPDNSLDIKIKKE